MTPGERDIADVDRLTEQGRQQTDRARRATDAAHETAGHVDRLTEMINKATGNRRDT